MERLSSLDIRIIVNPDILKGKQLAIVQAIRETGIVFEGFDSQDGNVVSLLGHRREGMENTPVTDLSSALNEKVRHLIPEAEVQVIEVPGV